MNFDAKPALERIHAHLVDMIETNLKQNIPEYELAPLMAGLEALYADLHDMNPKFSDTFLQLAHTVRIAIPNVTRVSEETYHAALAPLAFEFQHLLKNDLRRESAESQDPNTRQLVSIEQALVDFVERHTKPASRADREELHQDFLRLYHYHAKENYPVSSEAYQIKATDITWDLMAVIGDIFPALHPELLPPAANNELATIAEDVLACGMYRPQMGIVKAPRTKVSAFEPTTTLAEPPSNLIVFPGRP